MNIKRSLLVFAKEPVPGTVKTRLIPAIGANTATRLYEKLLYQTLGICSNLQNKKTFLYCSDREDTYLKCQCYANDSNADLRLQLGSDLGERMQQAFAEALSESERAILIGTDCPEYSTDYLERAFNMLDQYDVVLGPARDKGYVLLGMKRLYRELFQNIPWSTGKVLSMTRMRLELLGLSWAELETLNDIDEPSDLVYVQNLLTEIETENHELA